jgi:hypothetical protein
MSESALIQIVPVLRPQSDGISDYALNLAHQLRQTQGVITQFIVCDPQWDGPSRVEGFAVRRLRARTEAGIWSLLASAKESSPAVLLHYCGYGYDARGLPLWLSRGMGSWLAEASCGMGAQTRRFATVFHDTWPSSAMPFGKAFYREMFQQWIVKRLHRYSHFSVTSAWRLLEVLNKVAPKKTLWLPTPSSVPVTERSGEEKQNRHTGFRVVIFGKLHSRCATVQAHSNLLHTLEKKKLLASATVLGAADTEASKRDIQLLQKTVSPERIEVLGQLNAEAASHVLARADLLLSHRTGEAACQSGAIMAALGIGCAAVLRDGRNSAPLNEDEHFIASDDSKASVDRFERMTVSGKLESIAAAGQKWYQQHADWKAVARKYSEALFENKLAATAGTVEFRLRQPLMKSSIRVRSRASGSGSGFSRC